MTPLTIVFLFTQTYDTRCKQLKAAKAGPHSVNTSEPPLQETERLML